jgi:hypothetical protein
MLNSNLKKNRKMFQQRYASILQSLHAPYVSVTLPILPEDKSPGSLESLASRGDSWAVLCTGGAASNQVSRFVCTSCDGLIRDIVCAVRNNR